jgi:hypothetical protein
MSLKLPTKDSAVRELFDVRDLAAFGNPVNRTKAATFRETLATSRQWLVSNPEVKAVHQFVFRADGDLWLVKITARSWSKVWNFGQ